MKDCILLIGLPGCGKTTLGREAARRLGLQFIDMDQFIELLAGQTVAELFAQGEEAFRDAETVACQKLATRHNTIIAAGGGVVKRPQNIQFLRENCHIIYLDRPVEDILEDIDTASRPLLSQGAQALFDLYRERDSLYRQMADEIFCNSGNKARASARLCELLKNHYQEGSK